MFKDKIDIQDIDTAMPQLRMVNIPTVEKCLKYLVDIEMVRKTMIHRIYTYELTHKGKQLLNSTKL